MPQNEKKSNVAAVVVTYNRLELLRQCVEALRAQTTVCDILIVDNASTDGTAQWLASQPDLHYRNTGSNLGGAGGFNCGMRWAVEAGYDYVWVIWRDFFLPSRVCSQIRWRCFWRCMGWQSDRSS